MPKLPPSSTAWSMFILGTLLLLLSLRSQSPLWSVVFGLQPPPLDGSHYAGAVFYGLPPMVMAGSILGISVAKSAWRSLLTWTSFAVTLLLLFGWLVLVIRELI